MKNLIKKYDRPGPRYTSFPPVPFWKGPPSEELWIDHIEQSLEPKGPEKGIDLYIHIPYCESLCYYCGCNRTITKNKNKGTEYVDLLKKEWLLYTEKISTKNFLINSIHLGGGTPTFLPPEDLGRLFSFFQDKIGEDFLGSIEVDPRTCTTEHLDVLKKYRFSRISMGIQDFDSIVQKSIHREQSFELVENLVKEIRARKFQSVNFDLIYGLPNQTTLTIKRTIELVCQLSPNMMAFYSYAHLPDRIKNQKLIPEDKLPIGEEKRILYEEGKRLLEEANFQEIGLDHFATKDSYLSLVQNQGKLLRNFMGYTDKKSRVLIGLGITSISNSSLSFIQNHHDLKPYINDLEQNKLPISKGHIHNEHDIILEEIIQDIMCNYKIELDKIDLVPYSEEVKEGLEEMVADGLLTRSQDKNVMAVTHIGKPFLRNISMLFDPNLRKTSSVRFSRTI